MDKIQYISPSAFYYWEKCSFQAVLSKQPTCNSFFPKHPDADLGSLIHKFYEKQNEWNIESLENFNSKWNDEISKINKQYQSDKLQCNFYPIQWHSKYYAIKKQLLCKNLILRKKKEVEEPTAAQVQYLYEKWINNEIVGGKIDLIVKENDKIKQIVDFKTGNIYEKNGKKIQLKEVCKQQLALYCAVILEQQDFMPDLFIETMDGKKVKIEIEKEYIETLVYKVISLKEKINSAIETNTINSLANCNSENCEHCNYRPYCEIYQSTFTNKKIGSRIDIKGRIIEIKANEVIIGTNNNRFTIKKIKEIEKYVLENKCNIYNLYFPENEDNLLYETINTVIEYE
jgi:RecB family exonuclease